MRRVNLLGGAAEEGLRRGLATARNVLRHGLLPRRRAQGGPTQDRAAGAYHFGDVISKAHYDLFLLRRARAEAAARRCVDAGARVALRRRARARSATSLLRRADERGAAGRRGGEVPLKHGEIMSEFTRYRSSSPSRVLRDPARRRGSRAALLVQVAADDVPARSRAGSATSRRTRARARGRAPRRPSRATPSRAAHGGGGGPRAKAGARAGRCRLGGRGRRRRSGRRARGHRGSRGPKYHIERRAFGGGADMDVYACAARTRPVSFRRMARPSTPRLRRLLLLGHGGPRARLFFSP